MWRFKFSAWAVVLMMTALSFGACDNDDDDDTFVPPSNITEALKQVYPAAQNVEWEMKGAYYVADCWVSNDELEVWFDTNANWVMTENELNSIDQLVPALRKICGTAKSWCVMRSPAGTALAMKCWSPRKPAIDAPWRFPLLLLLCPDRKSTRLNSSHANESRMPSSA